MKFSSVKESTTAENVLIKIDKAGTPLICAGLSGSEVAPLEVLTKGKAEGEDELATDASWDAVYVDGVAFSFSATENMKVMNAIGIYRVKVPSSASNTKVGTYQG